MGKNRIPKRISKIQANSPLSTWQMIKEFKNIKWRLLEKVLSEFIDKEDIILQPFKELVSLEYDKEIENIKKLLLNLNPNQSKEELILIIDNISIILKSFALNIVNMPCYTNLTQSLVNNINGIFIKAEDDCYKTMLENMYIYGAKEPKKIKFFLTDLQNSLIDIKHSTFMNYEESILHYIYTITLNLISEINNLAKGIIAFTYVESYQNSAPYIQVSYICGDTLLDNDFVECKIKYKSTQNCLTDYKDLNFLAESNGFKYTRSSGGHGIFENENGHIIVIPQGRSIGKGLSLKIQKDILQSKNLLVPS